MSMKSIVSSKDKALINEAAKQELTAQNMYRYFSNCMRNKGYFGFSELFKNEAKDEGEHYQIVADFMANLGDEVDLPVIPAQEYESDEVMDVFSNAFDAEVSLKEFYENMYETTSDVSVKAFAMDMVKKQTNAVGEYYDHLAALDACKNNPAAILVYDGRFL
jgi:ferritin